MPCFRLTISYDGTNFAGSQIQPSARTVQGELEQALQRIAGVRVAAVFAGRTDRGVHAAGQVACVCLPRWGRDAAALQRALHARLASDLAVTAVAPCAESFNPRFDAAWREYRYWLAPGATSPFLRRYAWTPRAGVDIGAMDSAGRLLLGTHDFASFAGGGEGVPWAERANRMHGTTRTILRCACRGNALGPGPGSAGPGEAIEFRVAANGFLPRMVRNIVGALVEIGQGRQDQAWLAEVLAARDRRQGSVVAPAHGLILWRVGFADDALEEW